MGSVNAGVVTDFTDEYDVANWTQSLNGGSINLSAAPFSIMEISSNTGNGFAMTDFTIAAVQDGLVAFTWLYSTEEGESDFDPFGWLLNGSFIKLTNGALNAQTDRAEFSVTKGDTFGFRTISIDSKFGSSTTIISDFSVSSADPTSNSDPTSNPIPEPTSLALFGLGFAGLSLVKRRRET